MRLPRFLPWLALVVACGSSGGADAGPPSPFVARFTLAASPPAFLDVPFPSNAYMPHGKFVTVPGLDRVFKQNSDVIAKQLEHLDGWSRIAPAMFAIDDMTKPPNSDSGEPSGAGIDRTSLPADENACKADSSSVFLFDLMDP